MKYALSVWVLALFVAITGSSCKKDVVVSDLGSLSFSVDTVLFDTVFTQRGTATRNFKVYNSSNKTLRITSISLANPNSQFRINVDGVAGKSFTDVDILPNDSIFVFVEATIDPNGGNSPLIVTDSILFSADGLLRDVDLVAWGQDANYFYPDTYSEYYPPYKVLEPNAVWTNNKPYVIYGYVVVDSLNSLTIEAGTKIHFHSGSGLWVYNGGQITVNGTKDQPVVFQGDRLEPAYKDLPGQWDRILINEGTKNNVFEYAVIKNALIGIQAETLMLPYNLNAPTSANKLELKNCVVQNNSALGIFARNYKIEAKNLVLTNGGQYCLGISGGGEYKFTHATIANYFTHATRNTPALFMTNAYQIGSTLYVRPIVNTHFTNCIIYGSNETEFDVEIDDRSDFVYTLENCLVKRKDALSGNNFINLTYNQEPQFKDISTFDYHLNSGSAAINLGKNLSPNFNDFDGDSRDSNTPDAGAFEFK